MRRIVMTAMAVLSLASIGCGVNRSDFTSDTARLGAEKNQVWSVPSVIGTELGEVTYTGSSMRSEVFGIKISGDGSTIRVPFIMNAPTTPRLNNLQALAAGRAVDEAQADGLYVTMIETRQTGFPPIYTKKFITVSGKPVSIKQLGSVDREEYIKTRLYGLAQSEEVGPDGGITPSPGFLDLLLPR